YDFFYCCGPVLGSQRRSFNVSAAHFRSARGHFRSGHRQQVGIWLLNSGQAFRSFYRASQALFVKPISGSACSSTIEGGPHRNNVVLFRHVLVDRVISEARERTVTAGDQDFYLITGRVPANALEDLLSFISC